MPLRAGTTQGPFDRDPTDIRDHFPTKPHRGSSKRHGAPAYAATPPPSPDIDALIDAKAALDDIVMRHRGSTGDIAQQARTKAHIAWHTAWQRAHDTFIPWSAHLHDLVIVAWAHMSGRAEELATNSAGLALEWEEGTLVRRHDPLEVGLAAHAVTLSHLLAICDNRAWPASSIDEQTRATARTMRVDALKIASHMIEAMMPTCLSNDTMRLADTAHLAARSLLRTTHDSYAQGALALALHRLLPAMSEDTAPEATYTIAHTYQALITTADTPRNTALLASYGNLVHTTSDAIVAGAHTLFTAGRLHMDYLAHHGVTPDIRCAATLIAGQLHAHMANVTAFAPLTSSYRLK